MSSTLIDLARQCCDADEYLDMGYACAQAGQCYNPLRPIGDTLWFALPYVFNTSENIFFYLQAALLAIIGVSVFYLLKKALPAGLFLLVLLFLTWPTFFHTLSDTPATLFFIEGIVLALIGKQHNRAGIFFAAGISLGLSALLRAAYFYPLIISALLFGIYMLWQKQRQWSPVFILSFIIPLALQFFSTWQHTGQWQFLSENRSRAMMTLHLNSDAAGYDTYLPQTGVYWPPACKPDAGLLPSLASADISSTICILHNRFEFYLGSYATSTFLGAETRNFFDSRHAEKTRTDYLIRSKSTLPLPPGKYRYSVLLWAAENNSSQPVQLQVDNVAISKTTTADSIVQIINPLSSESISITDKPQRYTADINNTATGYIIARINSSNSFSMQNELLEPAPAFDFVQPNDTTKNSRIFSRSYLIINVMVMLFAIFYLSRLLVKTRSPVVVFVGTLLFALLTQCLVIIPEQRYLQGFLCVCWLICFLPFSNRQQHQ